jgi:tetratricopeptide (TPR) repeat protein
MFSASTWRAPRWTRSICETRYGLSVARALEELAIIYVAERLYAEAEPLYKRSLAITEKARGPDHPAVDAKLGYLAHLYRLQGRNAEAEPLYKHSIAILEKEVGPDRRSPDIPSLFAQSLARLAFLYERFERYAEAEALLWRSLAIVEKAQSPDFLVRSVLDSLAFHYQEQGRFAEAEPHLKRILAIVEKAQGPDHSSVGWALDGLAHLYFLQEDWARAADHWRRSTGIIQRRAGRGLARADEGSSKGESQRFGWQFVGLVKTTHRLATRGGIELEAQVRAMFETAQWALGS